MLRPRQPVRNSNRHYLRTDRSALHSGDPEKSLLGVGHLKRQGRGFKGHITVRHRGGGVKKKMRMIDWKREKHVVPGVVKHVEYDPTRSANIALIFYRDGEKRYIIAPEGLEIGQEIVAGPKAEVRVGNALPLKIFRLVCQSTTLRPVSAKVRSSRVVPA